MAHRTNQKRHRTKSPRGSAPAPALRAASAPESLAPDRGLLRIAATFFAIYALMQTAVWWLALRGALDPFIEATTGLAAACVTGTGVAATVSGNRIALSSRILQIDLDCTAISLAAVFSALVLAYPLRWRVKVAGLAIGLPAIALANMARLTAVAHLSERLGNEAFRFVHDYLFMIGMVTVVVALWGGYLAIARRYAARS